MKTLFVIFLIFVITSGGTGAAAQTIEGFLISKVDEKLADIYSKKGYRYAISTKWIPDEIKEISDKEFTSLKLVSSTPRGYEMAYVNYNNRQGQRRATIQIHIALEQFVPVANQMLSKGQAIDSSTIEYRWVDVTRFKGTYITNSESLKGKAAGRMIKKGQAVRKVDLIEVPVVKSGDLINLVYKINGINIVIPCIARQDKAVGQEIKLINKDTGKTYVAILTSKSSATWEKTL